MKLRLLFSLAAASVLSAAGADTPPANTIAVYLAPDASQPALLQVPAADARLADAKPATDTAKAAQGWKQVSLAGPFTGYVQSSTTRKDMSVRDGTPVHIAAEVNSPVLGTAPASPALVVTSPAIDWCQVSFPGPITVFFQPTPPAAAISTPAATPAAPAATTAPTVANTAPAATATPTRPSAAPGAPPPPTPTQPAATAKKADASDVGHYYYGTLKYRTNPTIRGPINVDYALYNSRNEVVALVDLNDVVLPGSPAAFLGKSVKVYGTAYTDASLPFAVIHAQSLQAN